DPSRPARRHDVRTGPGMAAAAVSGPAPHLELEDIQGLAARGYGNLRAAGFLLIGFDDPSAAGRWLGDLAGSITRASERPAERSLNVAFTAPGLTRLGLAPRTEDGFAAEFVEGMVTPHRRRLLGDVEASAPEGWGWGGPATPPVDAVLLLY